MRDCYRTKGFVLGKMQLSAAGGGGKRGMGGWSRLCSLCLIEMCKCFFIHSAQDPFKLEYLLSMT